MPAKYSHVKKRSASGLLKKGSPNVYVKDIPHHHTRSPNPHIDKSISQALSAVSQLERTIARILLLRYQQDIARLFSTRLYSVALVHLPTFAMRCIALGGPGWLVHNHDSDEIKDFFRAAISMDMRQAGERVATKSVLWSYTALRHFAMSNGVSVCSKRGLHSLHLIPFFPALQAYVDVLETLPPPTFSKPPLLGSLQEGQEALEDACELKFGLMHQQSPADGWDVDWRTKVRVGYERLTQTLWRVSREFDVRGYGTLLREKLLTKWCDCGCSTDHLGEVCERTVREDEEMNGVRVGKQREWDGRGTGVFGWETEEEEDIWEVDLDFGGLESQDDGAVSRDGGGNMTIADMIEWRYFKAEREKEEGNVAFRQGAYEIAVKHYEVAHDIEPELPHYQLNLAAAHLKLSNWIEAEKACTNALGQHRSSKGYYRRARARRMLNRTEDAIKDLRSALKLQPANIEATTELAYLLPPSQPSPKPKPKTNTKTTPPPASFVSSQAQSQSPSASSSHSPLFPGLTNSPGPAGEAPESRSRKETGRKQALKSKTKQVPFVRTRADERRLKIVLIPATAAEMSLQASDRVTYTTARHQPNYGDVKGKGKGKESLGTNGSGKDKGKTSSTRKSESSKWRELDEIVRSETIVYPAWDRYIIRRLD